MDQAETLRKLKSERLKRNKGLMKKIAITSGKGGVGKTNVVINLAIALQRMKKKITIFDADLGLANIDILLGLTPKYNIVNLISDNFPIEKIMIEGPSGIKIIPASSGIQEITNLDPFQEEKLLQELAKVEDFTDILLIDTAAGISNLVLSFLLSSEEIVLVTNSEPTSIVDAYAVVKVVSKYDMEKPISVIVNSVRSNEEGEIVYNQLKTTVDRFLGRDISLLGFLPYDESVIESVKRQEAVLEAFPKSEVSRAFSNLSRILLNKLSWVKPTERSDESWKKMLNLSENEK